jgi:hypothetical protein
MTQPKKWLEKKAKRGVRGYPAGTVAFYGPDERRATKAVAGVVLAPQEGASELRRWFRENGDIRKDEAVMTEIVSFLREHDVKSVAMASGMLGCPHEEGVDYPVGEDCPSCPYWAGRDRWANALKGR